MIKYFVYAQLALKERLRDVRGRDADRGASALEWVLIAAGTATIIALVYIAINSKAAEKIGIINDA